MQEVGKMADSRVGSRNSMSTHSRAGMVPAAFVAMALVCGTACGFTVDTAIPAGHAVVNAIDGDAVSLRQDLRDTKGEWFYWAFRSPTPAAPW